MQDRDIELVLVTGAGASREFGVNGIKLPMMGDWSNAVVEKLQRGGPGYLGATGLSKDLDGPTFEKMLGEFLHRTQAFEQIGPLIEHTEFQANPGLNMRSITDWHGQAVFHLGRIVELIHESLYENFDLGKVDERAAAAAYGALFAQLGVGAPSSLVVATTNYDTIAESAIASIGGLPDWGAAPSLQLGASDTPLRVDRLMEGYPRFVPVLHLHGRIGWFRKPDGVVYSANHGQYNAGYGVPVVMLPDPDKSYDAEPVIYELWQQLRIALGRAQRVFVLGHSLHDAPLVDALRQYVSPTNRIAVGLLADPDDPERFHASAGPTMEIMRRYLPQAGMIPIRFGEDLMISRQQVELWTQGIPQMS